MADYMSIGKVSKLKGVSIKSLRYYDRIGILRPAYVNEKTNYRYYTKEQMYLLDAITLCLKLGIPLKDLNDYVVNDTIDLQSLLYDGKMVAEERILEIRGSLEKLQDTLQNMSLTASGLAKIPEQVTEKQDTRGAGAKTKKKAPATTQNKTKSKPKKEAPSTKAQDDTVTETKSNPSEFRIAQCESRLILLVPLEEMDTPKYYGQYILRLFVAAQQMGLSASYPSGVLHYYDEGLYKRFMFLTLTNNAGDEAVRASISTNLSKITGQAVFELPEGGYYEKSIKAHAESDPKPEIDEVCPKATILIETDTTDAAAKDAGYPFVLQCI